MKKVKLGGVEVFKDDLAEYLDSLGFQPRAWGDVKNLQASLGTQNSADTLPHQSFSPAFSPELGSKLPLLILAEADAQSSELGTLAFSPPVADLFKKMIQAMGLPPQSYEVLLFLGDEVSRQEAKNKVLSATPHIVLLMGEEASQLYFEEKNVGLLRGQFVERAFENLSFSILNTFHPAYLMKEASMKKAAWEDLQLVIKKLRENSLI